MDFIPGNMSNDFRLVGPAGTFGAGFGGLPADFFGASGGGGLGGAHSIIPTPRPDPAAENSPEMLKMYSTFKQHLPAKCTFPTRPGTIARQQDHNAVAELRSTAVLGFEGHRLKKQPSAIDTSTPMFSEPVEEIAAAPVDTMPIASF